MAAPQRHLRALLLVLVAGAAAQLCQPGTLTTPIPPSCMDGSTTLPGALPPGWSCPMQPGSANGGMLFDVTNVDAQRRQPFLTGFSFLGPSAYPSGASPFPRGMLSKRKNPPAAPPRAFCPAPPSPSRGGGLTDAGPPPSPCRAPSARAGWPTTT